MAIIATGSKTIIDLSDGKSLSAYLGSTLPKTQIKDLNTSTFSPDWTSTHLVLTPVIYANQTQISLDDSHLSIEWKKKEGTGSETVVSSGTTLTVSTNVLDSISAGTITYIAYITYTDPDTSLPINAKADMDFALVKNGVAGTNAQSIFINGQQVFKYDAAGSVTPSQITLTATAQNISISQWQYWNGTAYTKYPNSTSSSNLSVNPTDNVFNNNVAQIKVTTSNVNIYDIISVYKVNDGQKGDTGESAVIAYVTNENIGFSANSEGKVAAKTVTSNVVALRGTTKVTPTVGTITGCPTGMTATKGTATNNEIPITITIAANSNLGSDSETSGTINVPITAPVSTTLHINWTKVNTGLGEDSVSFSVFAPNGTVFVNSTGTLPINTFAMIGSTEITSSDANFKWYKFTSGSWNEISGATSTTYTVSGSDVVSQCSFKCVMTYPKTGGKTYSDVITFQDKTDNYQADIDSTAGDIFKNTVGTACLICRVWQNGTEIDALKSTTYSKTAPTSPSAGTFYYQIQNSGATTKLMRYSGSQWVDVTSDATYGHTKTYKWYRRDKDGNPLNSGSQFATGKVIYVDGDDVEVKTVFVCEVE